MPCDSEAGESGSIAMAYHHILAVGLLLALCLPTVARSQQAAPDKQAEPGMQAASHEKERIAERDRLAVEVQKLRNEGKLADAIAAAEKVLVIEREMAADHPQELAFGLDYTAGLHEQLEEYAAARKLLAERHALVSKLLGKDDWRVTDARLALDKATLLEKFTPEERRQLARANQLGSAFGKLYAEGKFRDALAPAVEAQDITRRLLGEMDVGYGHTLNNLAMLHKSLGDFTEAGSLARQALAIYKDALGEKHPSYVVGLNNLAEVYSATRDFAQAEPLYKRALELRKEMLGDKHPDYAQSLNSLAVLFDQTGDYVKAEPLYRQALEIRKAAFGEKDPSYATTLNNLAGLYVATGDDVKAESLYRQVLAIRKESLGEKHPAYADTLDDLAAVYRDRRDYARAEPLYRQALEIRKATFGEQHPAYAKSVNNLALLYQSMEEYAKAQPLFIDALVINGNAFGENHPDFAVSVNNLATFYQAEGKFEKAASLHEKVIQIDKRTLGEKHPGYAIDLYNLAVAYQSMGDDAKAAPLFLEALHVYHDQLDLMAAVQSERQQLNMFARAEDALGDLLAVTDRAKLPTERVYAEVLVWKGAVGVRQRAIRRLRETLATNGSSEAARLFDDLTRKSQALANLSLAAVEPGHEEEHRRRLADLSDEVAQAERSLAGASREFRRELEQNHRTPADLRIAMPADAVLVDLVEYNHFTPPTEKVKLRHWERHLAAFLVRRDMPLERIELGPVAPIDRSIQAWRRKF
ncbi:MAG TPA: tetratricopeptide repeat protein, partial [Pirellulales bacterium]|nr:tetratricopeptide repeat protein [Pirellulales bacterium]